MKEEWRTAIWLPAWLKCLRPCFRYTLYDIFSMYGVLASCGPQTVLPPPFSFNKAIEIKTVIQFSKSLFWVMSWIKAVCGRPISAGTRVSFHTSQSGIYGRWSGPGTASSRNIFVFCCQYHSTGAPFPFIHLSDTLYYQRLTAFLNGTIKQMLSYSGDCIIILKHSKPLSRSYQWRLFKSG